MGASRVRVTPEQFTLVPFDAAEIARVCEDAAAVVGFPPDVEITVEVDEELFPPLVGQAADLVDGRAAIWISGANLEDVQRRRTFSEARARVDLAMCLLRATDRLGDAFAGAPADAELTRAEKAAWEVWAIGRLGRLGLPARRQKTLYEFRLQHGFTDAADAAFDRLWQAETMTWAGLREVCAETGAADQPESKVPVDLLRRG